MSATTNAPVATNELLSQDEIFRIYELAMRPESLQQCGSAWLQRILQLCGSCGANGDLFEMIRQELQHRQGR